MYFRQHAMGNNLSTVFKNDTWAQLKTADNYAKPMFFPYVFMHLKNIYFKREDNLIFQQHKTMYAVKCIMQKSCNLSLKKH